MVDDSDGTRESKNVRILAAGPGHLHVSPYGFIRSAEHFLNTHRSSTQFEGFSPVPYYLVCRTIELGLKAYLLATGDQTPDLAGLYGHNMTKALREADQRGLSAHAAVSDQTIEEVVKADAYYASKGFESFQIWHAANKYRDLPDIRVLEAFAEDLVANLKQFCLDAA